MEFEWNGVSLILLGFIVRQFSSQLSCQTIDFPQTMESYDDFPNEIRMHTSVINLSN